MYTCVPMSIHVILQESIKHHVLWMCRGIKRIVVPLRIGLPPDAAGMPLEAMFRCVLYHQGVNMSLTSEKFGCISYVNVW
jgi:hypothetical protein